MLHKGQESSSRKLVWVEGQSFGGWGCSECVHSTQELASALASMEPWEQGQHRLHNQNSARVDAKRNNCHPCKNRLSGYELIRALDDAGVNRSRSCRCNPIANRS